MIHEKYRNIPKDAEFTVMLGAACGDISGSVYERRPIKRKITVNEMITQYSRFTDDTVMTCAVARGICRGLSMLPKNKIASASDEETVKKAIIVSMREYGRKYPGAGYGASFMNWLDLPEPEPYGSWGNGSAMRASFAGWAAKSLDEAEKLGEISAAVTHDHPDGIKGAKVVAGIIYLLRNGADKMGVYKYASGFYNMDFKLDDIRDLYCFDVSCTGTVPPAIRAFLEGKNFAEVISLAISLGGDSDTLAAIAASMAEVIYPMPTELCRRTISKLDGFLLGTLISAVRFITER